MSLKGPGESGTYDGTGLRVAIVHGRWNMGIIGPLVEGAKKSLAGAGVLEENITVSSVPGSYELPYTVQRIYAASQVQAAKSSSSGEGGISATDLLSSSTSDVSKSQTQGSSGQPSTAPFDAIIAIGVLIKGQTMHFEYISDAVSHGLMRVQLDSGVPVVFGVLTLLNEEQGLVRAGKGGHNHGEDWGNAAVELGVRRRGWAEGRIV